MADFYEDLISGVPVVLPTVTPLQAYSPVFTITGGAMSGHAHQSSWAQDVYFMDLEISFTGGTTTGTITNFAVQLPLNPLTGTPYTIGGPTGARFMGGGVDGFSLLTNRFDATIQAVQGDTTVTLCLDSGNSYAAAGAGRSLRASIRIPIAEFLLTGYRSYGAGQAMRNTPGLMLNAVPPTALTLADFTTQVSCTIDSGDVVANANYWTLNNNQVTLYIWLDNISTAVSSSFSWVLPPTIPRPKVNVGSAGIVYDNSGTIPIGCHVIMNSNGQVAIAKMGGGNFASSASASYVRAQISWPVT